MDSIFSLSILLGMAKNTGIGLIPVTLHSLSDKRKMAGILFVP